MSCNLFSNKIATGSRDARNVAAYLAAQGDNELPPIILEGDLSEVISNDARSEFEGHKSSHIHFQLTSRDPLSSEDLKTYISEVFKGYGIDPANHPYVLAEHQKQREDGSGFDKHYHLLVAYTGLDGKALRANASYIKNETISRRTEMLLGRSLGNGKFSRAVLDHAVKTGDTELMAAITASGILDLPRADARKTKTENQIEKRLEARGLDIKPADIRALFKDVKVLEDGPAKRAEVARILAEKGLELSLGDKTTKITVSKDGHFVGTLDRFTDLRAKGDARLNLIAEITNEMNAQETPDAHLPTISKETEDGRTAAARAETIERDDAGRADLVEAQFDKERHEADREHQREVGRGPDAKSGLAKPAGRPAGANQSNGSGHAGDAENPALYSRRARLAAIRESLFVGYDGAASGHIPALGRGADAARAGASSLALNALEAARLSNAWAAANPHFKPLPMPLADTRSRNEIRAIRPSGTPQSMRLNALQQARLRAAFAPHQEYFKSNNVKPVVARANIKPRSQVHAIRPALPPTKILLNELQKARLNSALAEKRDALIAAAAFRKPERSEERMAIRPSGAMLPEHAAKLSTKQIRDAFAAAKDLSGSAKSDAIAALLKAHGLHLDAGAKSGVITINRALDNGSTEFLGSLDRFANLKTVDADRGAVIASIMQKVNASEAPKANLPPKEKEAKDGLAKRKNGRDAWREYAEKLDAKAAKVIDDFRHSGRDADSRLDQGRHIDDQKLVDRRLEAERRNRESAFENAANDRDHVRNNRTSARDDQRSRATEQRNERRDSVSGGSDRASNEHATAQANDIRADGRVSDHIESEKPAKPAGPMVSQLDLSAASFGWSMRSDSINLNLGLSREAPKGPALPSVAQGKPTAKKPSAPAMQPAPNMGVNHAVGGDFVTTEFDDGGDDQAKKRKAQEHMKRLAASLGPKM